MFFQCFLVSGAVLNYYGMFQRDVDVNGAILFSGDQTHKMLRLSAGESVTSETYNLQSQTFS